MKKQINIYLIIIILYKLLIYFYRNTYVMINYEYLFNLIIWLLLILKLKETNYYFRNINKNKILKDSLILSISYFVIYYLIGFKVGFITNNLNLSLKNFIINIIKYIIILLEKEYIRYYLLNYSKTKLNYHLVTIVFIISYLDFNILKLTKLILFKKIISNVITLICFNYLASYISLNGSYLSLIIFMLPKELLSFSVKYLPNYNWYYYGIFVISYTFLAYVFIYYELNGKKVFNKLRFSLYIGIIITLVLFVIGYFVYVPVGVMSNSMSPIYKRGDMLIYKKDKDIENIKVGDIVCYSYEDKLIMHRVIKISNNNVIKLTMQGDNVNSEDAIKVTKDNMIGKIVLIIPKLGYPSVWLYDLLS